MFRIRPQKFAVALLIILLLLTTCAISAESYSERRLTTSSIVPYSRTLEIMKNLSFSLSSFLKSTSQKHVVLNFRAIHFTISILSFETWQTSFRSLRAEMPDLGSGMTVMKKNREEDCHLQRSPPLFMM